MEASRMTMNRAATAIVRSRIFLERAGEELALALRIITEGPDDLSQLDPAERLARMQELERYLGRLRELQAMSRSAWDPAPAWWERPAAEGRPPGV